MQNLPSVAKRRVLSALLIPVVFGTLVAVAAARPSPAPAEAERVVARVGQRAITVGELEKRLAGVPPFQLKVLGETPDEIRRAYLEQLIEEELLVQQARAEKLDEQGGVKGRIRAVMRAAMLAQVRLEAGEGGAVTPEEIRSYFDAHKDKYRPETLLRLQQILVPTRQKATEIIKTIREDGEYRKDPIKGWKKLVAEHSIDMITKKRDGDLGFVRPDGTTKIPKVRLDPAVYEAAAAVKDGEVVPAPVPMGGAYAVVERRGSRKMPERTAETEAPAIRRKLVQDKYEKAVDDLLVKLRRQRVREKHPERADILVVTVPHGDLVPARRPGGLERARHKSQGSPQPAGRPGFLR
ncbi:MAG: peptidyl-prolyl cis-trans isomerase [Deltaproteobacteria bacterium]|jgi:peptidyl-prolyl cis-trans isomerase C|nr:peptidyl-prolyl cis-trans isomerase [Deltaproteobacteria bacterium]MBW2531506.1 peptidyl-prolyl cis-trans isomerase [Deltaproteobacteria bacterium]